jgi:hypothetical protein
MECGLRIWVREPRPKPSCGATQRAGRVCEKVNDPVSAFMEGCLPFQKAACKLWEGLGNLFSNPG